MVDDTVGIANCGLDSALSTCHLNTQTNIKKLQFGQNKCHKLHIGQSSHLCTNDTIDTWKLQKEKDFVQDLSNLVQYALGGALSPEALQEILKHLQKANAKPIGEPMESFWNP